MEDPKNHHLGTIAQLCRTISSKLRHASTIGKKTLLKTNVSPTCPHNMVNFGPLAAEICWRVWDTPANFNGFCVLAALLHGTPAAGVSETAALNRRRHLYLAGRPSRCALAHISSYSELLQVGPGLPKSNLWDLCSWFLQVDCPSCCPINSIKALKNTAAIRISSI